MRRENNFDILRLVFAWIIVLVHCWSLSRSSAIFVLSPFFQSSAAVEGFFAISGCLIVASWDRSQSLTEYFSRRAKRILPAYWFAIAFCLFLGSLLTTLPLARFWSDAQTWKYIGANLSFLNFLEPDLPGVFAGNPISTAMNGALWTLKIEVGFYLLVPLLAWLVKRIGRVWALGGIFCLSLAYRVALSYAHKTDMREQLPGQLVFFIVGAAVYYYYEEFEKLTPWRWVVVALLSMVWWYNHLVVVEALALPLLVMSVGLLLPAIRGVTKYGDFSYGTYVLHFPIIQALVAWKFFDRSPWLTFTLMAIAINGMAIFSWFVVERKFLRSSRVNQQEREETPAESVA